MGAAGFVDIYDEKAVVNDYKRRFPDHSLDRDWWYRSTDEKYGMNRVRVKIGDRWYLLVYWDDQGYQSGEDDFWFDSPDAKSRVIETLRAVGPIDSTEVWT